MTHLLVNISISHTFSLQFFSLCIWLMKIITKLCNIFWSCPLPFRLPWSWVHWCFRWEWSGRCLHRRPLARRPHGLSVRGLPQLLKEKNHFYIQCFYIFWIFAQSKVSFSPLLRTSDASDHLISIATGGVLSKWELPFLSPSSLGLELWRKERAKNHLSFW